MTATKPSTLKAGLFGLIIGSVFTFVAYSILMPTSDIANTENNASSDSQPLYWVAPHGC